MARRSGGIASALQDHDAIMTPGGNGMYLDTFEEIKDRTGKYRWLHLVGKSV